MVPVDAGIVSLKTAKGEGRRSMVSVGEKERDRPDGEQANRDRQDGEQANDSRPRDMAAKTTESSSTHETEPLGRCSSECRRIDGLDGAVLAVHSDLPDFVRTASAIGLHGWDSRS